MDDRPYLSIGDVLALLQREFPDVTISKIRFLESRGLLVPDRTPSGYRKFYEHDVERLRWILRQQREHFLPLKVIKGRLEGQESSRPPALFEMGEPAPSAAGQEGGESQHRGREEVADVAATTQATALSAARAAEATDPDSPEGVNRFAYANTGRNGRERSGAILSSMSARAGAGTVAEGPRQVVTSTAGTAGAAGGEMSSSSPPSAQPAGPDRPELGTRTETGQPEPAASASRRAGERGREATRRQSEPPRGPSVQTESSEDEPSPEPRTLPASPTGGPRREVAALVGVSLTAAELAQASGLDVQQVADLESYGLIEGRTVAGVRCYEEAALVVAGLSASFARFGVEARHLRVFKHAAERQTGLYSQIVLPLLRQRNPEARQRALEEVAQLSELGASLQACFAKAALRDLTGA